ncbi:MAG: hypothetical protein MUC34_11310 [Anaerolineae bacterium]|nr:hypothetical protein [Anaerolineae bacterium]
MGRLALFLILALALGGCAAPRASAPAPTPTPAMVPEAAPAAGKIDVVRVNILDEQNGPLLAQFGFNTTPEFYLLDRSGEIVAFWDGPVEPDELRAAFDRVLE